LNGLLLSSEEDISIHSPEEESSKEEANSRKEEANGEEDGQLLTKKRKQHGGQNKKRAKEETAKSHRGGAPKRVRTIGLGEDAEEPSEGNAPADQQEITEQEKTQTKRKSVGEKLRQLQNRKQRQAEDV